MSATELATVVEGWATVAGLWVVIAGAVFAGAQLRQEARAERFQTVIAVIGEVLTTEVGIAWREVVSRLPDEFDLQTISPEERQAVALIAGSHNRLGSLLAAGFVSGDDIFRNSAIVRVAIESWEKTKHIPRANEQRGVLPGLMYHEYLASRAQAYLDRNGVKVFGILPRFDADPAIVTRVAEEVGRARSAA